jgi:hypothetical protein
MEKPSKYIAASVITSGLLWYYRGSVWTALGCLAVQALVLAVILFSKDWRALQEYRLRLGYKVFKRSGLRSGAILVDETPGKYRFEVLLNSATDELAFTGALKQLSESLEDKVKVERLLAETHASDDLDGEWAEDGTHDG